LYRSTIQSFAEHRRSVLRQLGHYPFISATVLSNGQALIVGGEVSAVAQQLLNSSEVYDPQVLITGQETPAAGGNPVPSELYKP
jgi:hypothetical protein